MIMKGMDEREGGFAERNRHGEKGRAECVRDKMDRIGGAVDGTRYTAYGFPGISVSLSTQPTTSHTIVGGFLRTWSATGLAPAGAADAVPRRSIDSCIGGVILGSCTRWRAEVG